MTRRSPHASRQRALIGINAALLAALGLTYLAGSGALAQDRGDRGRGSYLMVGGEIQGGNANALYILDTNNEEMIAVRYNDSRRALEGLGYRDVRRDASEEGGR